MSRAWTPEEIQAASEAMKAQGHMGYEEFKIEYGLQMLEQIMKEWQDNKTQLAKALGTSRQNVSQIFKGAQSFTLKQIRIISARYELTPDQIVLCFALK